MTRSVWRKRAKIIGLVLSILMLGVWVFSVMFVASYVSPRSQWGIAIADGQINFSRYISITTSSGVSVGPSYAWETPQMSWTEVASSWLGFNLPGKYSPGRFHIPIWLLVVAVGFPTAVLWWRDRRPKAGSCMACKYDLTGNVSGTCPECGTRT